MINRLNSVTYGRRGLPLTSRGAIVVLIGIAAILMSIALVVMLVMELAQ